MKKPTYFVFGIMVYLAASTSAISQTDLIEIATQISHVTIHLQGAELIQSEERNLSVGRHRLVFTGLSPKLDPKSIQLTATNGISILSITSKVNFLKEITRPVQAEVLQDSIEILKIAIQDLVDEQKALEEEKDMLQKNKTITGSNTKLTVPELKEAADFYRLRMTEINKLLSVNKREKRSLDLQHSLLNKQFNQLNQGREQTSEVFVDVLAEQATESEFRLRYIVNDAGWSPVYDLIANGLNEPITLKYRALAFNNTGIDWENVQIRLSTADPYQGAGQPKLSPWVLTIPKLQGVLDRPTAMRQQRQLDGYQQSQNFNNYSFLHDLNPDAAQNVVEFETIEISELSKDFDIETPYTIPADRKPYSIQISEDKLHAEFKHFAVPKLDHDAFLLAQVTGWESLDLISGPIQVYRNENFIGLAQLNANTLSDTLELSLGRDKNVVIQRTKLKDFSKKKFLSGNITADFTWQTRIKNNHSTPITIELQDQVPISNTKEIEVSVKDISNARHIKNSGKLIWEFDLKPADVQSLKLSYSIKHPNTMEIQFDRTRKMVSPRFF